MNRLSFLSVLASSSCFYKGSSKNERETVNEIAAVNNDARSSSIIDIKQYGVKGDGHIDDSRAIQVAVDDCIKFKKTLYLSRPSKSYLCKSKIIISGQIYIYGDGMSMCGLNFLNSDGFEILEGVSNVIFERFSINQAIRYTQTRNLFTAIKVLGSTKKRPYTHVYRDVFIDGFNTAFDSSWLWDSHFDNIKVLFGQIGFNIKGTSVNNNISNCSVSVSGGGSKGVFFSDAQQATEGWRITNLLTYNADIGIHSLYTSNVYVTTPILDFCKEYGILLESGKGPSTNWQVLGGYIAMSGRSKSAISVNNEVNNNQIRGCKISNVDILAYPGSSCEYGIELKGVLDQKAALNANSFTNIKNEYFAK
ncbi:glycosyl hydrolase family 28-related protein [Sphingobacterium sp. SYP-B4668]|uniref:glycosyl hydrolase family 28-related protein n=1 Tax=Sphingobacterium sp. SYP-B4668 TaxID=2996035 RepID=UPI0022DD46B7|nr:glycosyl hydrolase family 28-related protein [Sphingobacterium sp. SYP-B4668]